MTSDEVESVAIQLQELLLKSHNYWQELKSMPQAFDENKDSRVSTFSKLSSVLEAGVLANFLSSRSGMQPSWWEQFKTGNKLLSDKHIQQYINSYGIFTHMYFFQAVFSIVESSIRNILRGIDPYACNSGTAEFKSIYECLLAKLTLEKSEILSLLDLCRLLRNTVHNNAVYYHKSKNSEEVIWNGEKFCFFKGKVVDFPSWELTVELTNGLIEALWLIINDEIVINHNGLMQDLLPLYVIDDV